MAKMCHEFLLFTQVQTCQRLLVFGVPPAIAAARHDFRHCV